MTSSFALAAVTCAVLFGASVSPSSAQEPAPVVAEPDAADSPDSEVGGTIYDSVGRPVPGCRVLARVSDGAKVYVGMPSAKDGSYSVAVPSGGSYVIIALVSPTGGRMAWPEQPPLAAGENRDLQLPIAMGSDPRRGGKYNVGADRLFLSFVEDPALVRRQWYELQVDAEDFARADQTTLRGVLAFQIPGLNQVELGLRGGHTSLHSDVIPDESGGTDLEAWGKMHFYRSATTRFDLGAGGLVTLPTGDSDVGIGRDALQSNLFLATSYAFGNSALVVNVGVRVTGNGELAGVPLEGTVSGTFGVGLIAPASPTVSLVLEGRYEGERFKRSGDDARVGFGVNWSTNRWGQLRAFAALGLVDDAADAQFRLSYAFRF